MFRRTVLQRFEGPDAILSGPHKSVQDVAFHKLRVASKPHNIASLIDCCRRIPPRGWSIWVNVRDDAILPEHGMLGGMSSNGLVADTGDAHDLPVIIDRRCSSRAVAAD